MSRFRRERVSLERVLDLVPARAPRVEAVEDGEGLRLVIRRTPGFMGRALANVFTLPERKAFQLDRHGARVWRLCDGSTRVRDVVDAVARDEGWPRDRAAEAVVAFLATLSERRLVGFGEAA